MWFNFSSMHNLTESDNCEWSGPEKYYFSGYFFSAYFVISVLVLDVLGNESHWVDGLLQMGLLFQLTRVAETAVISGMDNHICICWWFDQPLPGAVAVVVAGDLSVGRELVQLEGEGRGQLGSRVLVSIRTRGAESEMRLTELMEWWTQTHRRVVNRIVKQEENWVSTTH